MKKSIILSALALVSAFAFVGCNKEVTPDTPKENKVHFTINASAPETKTYIEYDATAKTYTPNWHNGDQLGVFFDTWAENAVLSTTFSNTLANGPSASFSGEGTVSASEQTIYAFYPASAFAKAYASHVIGLTIPGSQKPTATSFDKAADLLVNKPYPTTISSTSVVINDMQFTRILSTLKLVITDGTSGNSLSSDKIKSVTITTKTSADESGEALTGRYQWDFENETGAINETVKTNSVTADLSANPIALNGSNPIYLMVNPTTLPKDSKLIIEISTDKHEISKTATLSTKAFEFPAGKVARLSITIRDTDTIDEAITEPTGTGWYQVKDASWLKAGDKIVITNTASTQALGSQNTNNRAYTTVSLTGEKLNVGSATQLTLVAGSQTGTFALQDGSNYLNAVSDENHLKSDETAVSDLSSWTITANKTGAKIFNVSLTSREIMQNKTNKAFSTYKSTQDPILIYKQYSLPELAAISISLTPDHTNKTIKVEWTDVANATNYEVTCTGKDAQNIAPDVEEATFTGLAYDTEYTITVTASATGYASSSDSKTQTLVNPAAKTITREKASITGVAAAGVTATETGVYSLTNATDSDLEVTPDGTVVTAASVSGGSLTYTVAPNTGSERDGSVTISVNGGNSITITISQLGNIVYYVKVTDASTLSENDQLLFVYETSTSAVAMSTTQNSNNRGSQAVTITSSGINANTLSASAQVITLKGSSGAWEFYTGDGYLYSPSANNYLRTQASNSSTGKWSITITGGDATINCTGRTAYYLQYNTSSAIFSCYKNTQKNIQIYRLAN